MREVLLRSMDGQNVALVDKLDQYGKNLRTKRR
jgi:hypothetical protein